MGFYVRSWNWIVNLTQMLQNRVLDELVCASYESLETSFPVSLANVPFPIRAEYLGSVCFPWDVNFAEGEPARVAWVWDRGLLGDGSPMSMNWKIAQEDLLARRLAEPHFSDAAEIGRWIAGGLSSASSYTVLGKCGLVDVRGRGWILERKLKTFPLRT